jgi:regulator of protease activity HflC (stomatin/prohibitin superfamily)
MKKKVIIVAAVLVGIVGGIVTIASCKRVGQGEVGVVWTMKDGVQDEVLSPGLHFESPWTKVKKYPVSQQQLVLSGNPSDYGKKEHADWHVDAPADGGMVKINMTVNYNFIADRVTELYSKFNGMDGDSIVDSMVQNSIIAYIKEVTPKFTVMDIYSDKRAEVSKNITEYLNTRLTEEYGINVSSALIIDVQLDEALQAKIQAKEQAKQDAEKAELDRKTAAAEAEVAKVNAEADAEVQKIKAEAEAEKTKIAAQAEAEANMLIDNSITEDLIRMKEAEARLKHGWVTVQGAQAVVTEK